MISPSTRVRPNVTIRKALASRLYNRRSRPTSNAVPKAPAIRGPATSANQKLPVSFAAE